jgi:protein-S-isoprenylcysteine O-methyltransferase Ste14
VNTQAARSVVAQAVRAVPPILFAVVVVLFSAALQRQTSRLDQPPYPLAVTFTLAYLAWLLAEVPVTFRRPSQPIAEGRTLLAYGLARVGTAAAAVLGPLPWAGWSAWMVLPLLAFVGGVLLRLAATRTLGRFYSHHVVRRPDHAVVTGGLYRLVRHPAYAGMLLAHVGFVGFFANVVSVVLLLFLIAAVVWRIRVEERVLWTVPGYPAYARGRARLLLGVW